MTPLDYADRNVHSEVAKYLRGRAGIDIMKSLESEGADLYAKDAVTKYIFKLNHSIKCFIGRTNPSPYRSIRRSFRDASVSHRKRG